MCCCGKVWSSVLTTRDLPSAVLLIKLQRGHSARLSLPICSIQLPTQSVYDWNGFRGGSTLEQSRQGSWIIRSGDPGLLAELSVSHPIAPGGYVITGGSITFSYAAGYGSHDQDGTNFTVYLAGSSTSDVVYASGTLVNYSLPHYSPPQEYSFPPGLAIPMHAPLVVVLQFANNNRNVQIPLASFAISLIGTVMA